MKKAKDKLNNIRQHNVIYRLTVKLKTVIYLVIVVSIHRLVWHHKFDWENVKILDSEEN